jgi:hypothetical protein
MTDSKPVASKKDHTVVTALTGDEARALRWTGKGRTVPTTVFVSPCWIHPELIDAVDSETIRGVH